jgi:hypothetical protein
MGCACRAQNASAIRSGAKAVPGATGEEPRASLLRLHRGQRRRRGSQGADQVDLQILRQLFGRQLRQRLETGAAAL